MLRDANQTTLDQVNDFVSNTLSVRYAVLNGFIV
jgi:hypothetical protein